MNELELSPDVMRRLLAETTDRLVAFVTSLPDQPAADVTGARELARSLKEPDPPESATPFSELLALVVDRATPKSFNTAGPGYLAYIPGGGLFHAALADLISGVTNRYVGVFAAAPAMAQLETNVIRWFCGFAAYGEGSGGILTTGGSLSTFSAVVTARKEKLPEDFLSGTFYVSDQAHHSVEKAAFLAGFPPKAIRVVETDSRFRMRVDHLRELLAEDRGAGRVPFLLVASAGTTNTGAVDDIPALADVAARESLWLHVDAAYGGFFLLTERGRRALAGIHRADSITLDPHKGLFLPYGTGALLVKDASALARAHAADAAYLPAMQEDPDFVDFCQVSPELSRAFRGLRVWLPFKMHGVGPFRRSLDEKLDLALWACEELRAVDGMEIVAEPQLSLLAFRLVRPGLDGAALDALNRDLLRRVNERQRVHLTGTVTKGRFLLRICVLSFRTHRDRMKAALEDVRAAVAEL